MVIFNSTTGQFEEYTGTTWRAVGQGILTTHEADLDAHTRNPLEVIRTGQYFAPWWITAASTLTVTADTIYALPLYVPRDLTIDALLTEPSVGDAGKIARMGVYSDDGNGYPDTLQKDYGTVSVGTAGGKIATGDLSLTKGVYWLVWVSDGTPTMRSVQFTISPAGNHTGNADVVNRGQGWYKDAVGTGALPTTFPTGATLTKGSFPSVVPRLKTLD